MKQQPHDAKDQGKMGKGAEGFYQSRNGDRDDTRSKEEGTSRVRSERQNVKEERKNRRRPLL